MSQGKTSREEGRDGVGGRGEGRGRRSRGCTRRRTKAQVGREEGCGRKGQDTNVLGGPGFHPDCRAKVGSQGGVSRRGEAAPARGSQPSVVGRARAGLHPARP